jgi:hypothetical protein
MEKSYVWHVLSILKKEHPELYRVNKKTKEQHAERQVRDHSGFRRLSHKDKNIIVLEPKSHIVHVPRIAKPEDVAEKEPPNLKEMKPVEGFESVWKEGKMRSVKPKTYRGSFQDKD